jgi:preprotein translocase subunit YajC
MEAFGGLLFPLLILLLFIPIFLSGRKQRRQLQEMQQLQAALEVGDVVTTTSGLRGTVVDADYEDTVDLEIADGVVTTWVRRAIATKELDSAVEPAADTAAATDTTTDTVDAPADTAVTTTARADADLKGSTVTRADAPVDTPSDANGSSRP